MLVEQLKIKWEEITSDQTNTSEIITFVIPIRAYHVKNRSLKWKKVKEVMSQGLRGTLKCVMVYIVWHMGGT